MNLSLGSLKKEVNIFNKDPLAKYMPMTPNPKRPSRRQSDHKSIHEPWKAAQKSHHERVFKEDYPSLAGSAVERRIYAITVSPHLSPKEKHMAYAEAYLRALKRVRNLSRVGEEEKRKLLERIKFHLDILENKTYDPDYIKNANTGKRLRP